MKDLLLYILKAVVDSPDQITIAETQDDTGLVTFTVTVASDDMGKVIGKGGKVINAIRQVVRISAIKEGKRVQITLSEPEGVVAKEKQVATASKAKKLDAKATETQPETKQDSATAEKPPPAPSESTSTSDSDSPKD